MGNLRNIARRDGQLLTRLLRMASTESMEVDEKPWEDALSDSTQISDTTRWEWVNKAEMLYLDSDSCPNC
jgi:hypothetical protein